MHKNDGIHWMNIDLVSKYYDPIKKEENQLANFFKKVYYMSFIIYYRNTKFCNCRQA